MTRNELMLMQAIFIGTALPAMASITWAQPDAVEDITVTGEQQTSAEHRAPSAFSTAIDVTTRAAPMETVARVLSENVGVHVQHFGGLGAFSTISIRGSSANQVPVYLDGIPLTQSQDQAVNLSNLPLDGLQTIEAYRGTVPVGFGGGGIGGVVNLVTRPADDEPRTEMSIAYGSFDTRKAVLTHTQRWGGTSLLANISYLGSEGDFHFFDDNGTPENPTDDQTSTRINNRFDTADLLLKGSHELGNGASVELLQEVFFKDQGVPGPGNTQFDRPSLLNVRSLTYLRLRRDGMFDDTVDSDLTIYGIYNLQKFKDPEGDFGARQDTHNQTVLVGGNTDGTWDAPYGQNLSWFAELAYERFFPFNETNPPLPERGPDQARLRTTVALQDEIDLFAGLVSIIPSLRFDQLWDEFSGVNVANFPDSPTESNNRSLWTPALGVAARPTSWLTIRGNLGRFQRAPNFSELFGNSGSVLGNAALTPETGINRDIGFVVDWPGVGWIDEGRFEYAFFYNNVRDLIAFEQVNPRRFRAFNIGDTRITGHEISATASALGLLGIDLNYTYQDSQNRSVDSPEGNQLPLRPANEVFVRPRLYNDWGSVYYEYTYLGANPTDRDNFKVVPARSIHSVGITAQPLSWLSLRLRADNVADANIRDLGDFPLPGLSITGGIEAVF